MQKITPFLMFNDGAEEAMHFYLSIFPDGEIVSGKSENGEKVNSVSFKICGQEIRGFNGGSYFTFSEGISLFVDCDTQEEVDALWEKLSEGGEKSQCGWVKDKFGVSWQIVPRILGELLSGEDRERANRVMHAMMQMSKLDIKTLQEA